MEFVTMNTGAQLPLLGLGTWQADENDHADALRAALDNGYRLFDTAYLYQNEAFLGNILNEYISSGKIKREELFITTKLSHAAHAPKDVIASVEKQLKALQLNYIDLYLIHHAFPFKRQVEDFLPLVVDGNRVPANIPLIDTWRAMESLYDAGKLKALGVSNFTPSQLMEVYRAARVKPSNLQIECHLYFPQTELRKLCKQLGITVMAYAPLGSPGRKVSRPNDFWPEGNPLADPTVCEIARRHKKTPAQVLLRWLTQNGISAIPKSVNPTRLVQNISIFDFELTDGEMKKLNAIDKRVRLFVYERSKNHPNYSWSDVVFNRQIKV